MLKGLLFWWGVPALVSMAGLYLVGSPREYTTARENRFLWGALLVGFSVGWFVRGP